MNVPGLAEGAQVSKWNCIASFLKGNRNSSTQRSRASTNGNSTATCAGAPCLKYYFQFHQCQRSRDLCYLWWSYLHKITKMNLVCLDFSSPMLWLSYYSVCKWRLCFLVLSILKWSSPFCTCSWHIAHSSKQQGDNLYSLPALQWFLPVRSISKGPREFCCLNTKKGKKYPF